MKHLQNNHSNGLTFCILDCLEIYTNLYAIYMITAQVAKKGASKSLLDNKRAQNLGI